MFYMRWPVYMHDKNVHRTIALLIKHTFGLNAGLQFFLHGHYFSSIKFGQVLFITASLERQQYVSSWHQLMVLHSQY